MPAKFLIEHDEEFYVFLKSGLPPRYRIEAQPSSSYYSEWSYHYELYLEERLLRTFEGDFRTVDRGSLVREARELLATAEGGTVPC